MANPPTDIPGDIPGDIDAVIAVARAAGARIMVHYNAAGRRAEAKADGSPITAADRAADACIAAALAELSPDIPLVSEERVADAESARLPGGLCWLVDPLDGTREFVDGNGEFTVNIALMRDQALVLGVVHAPTLDRTDAGVIGLGAWRLHGSNARAPLCASAAPGAGLRVVASRSHGDARRLERYLRDRRVADTRRVGSSLKFCLIAAGEADLYPRFGPTMEWDTAAAHAVLVAAGGAVETEDGAPLAYGKPGLRNPPFIAFGARPAP